jgi:type IV secretion system protein VirD4
MIGRVALLIARPLWRPLFWLVAASVFAIATARLYVRYIDHHPSEHAEAAVNVALGLFFLLVIVWRVSRWLSRNSGGIGALDAGPPPTSQGSARWGSGEDLGGRAGLILGRADRGRGPLVRYSGDAHILTVAPTGAGKGIGCVIPNLLDYPGSVLVTDPKGENYAVTARRRRALGQRVMALDPFGLVGGSACFNPLDELDPAGFQIADDAAALAEMLVVREPRESGDSVFWSEEAKALLTGLIIHATTSEAPPRRTLTTVWHYLSLPPRELTKLWVAMGKSTVAGGAVARAAAQIRQKSDRVRSGILAQAQSQMHFLESDRLARVMDRSSFSFTELKSDRVSLYLVLPPDRIDVCRRWLRLLVGSALRAVMRTRRVPAHRVLFLLDEFPALGALPPLERAVSLARGYSATCWLLAQDLAQLQALYPSAWPSFVANAGVVQAFGTNDVDTASYLSTMLGASTVRVANASRSRTAGAGILGFGGGAEVRESWGLTDRARPLLTPDEVRRLDPSTALLLRPGADPLRVGRIDYRRDRAFTGMYAENPMHQRA